jgi:hypothetical protein
MNDRPGCARLARIDRAVLAVSMMALAAGALLFGRANLIADSVDYYANLQRLSPAGGAPIVDNLHFADQRSPGFPVAALLPYLALEWAVAPLARTAVVELDPDEEPAGPPGMVPPRPLLLHQAPFHDFALPGESGRYRWTLAIALALTSYGFFFAGLAAMASALRTTHPELPGYSLVVGMVAGSPLLLQNFFATPLYATLTAFGASALFCASFVRAARTERRGAALAAGAWLGMVVLTRLDAAVFAAVLIGLLAVRRERVLGLRLAAGASWALVAWAAYNWRVFGTPVSFGILRGDINLLRVDFGYMFRCLLHPGAGIVFWSPLVCIGLAGVLAGKSPAVRSLGLAALPLIALWVVRIPVMLVDPSVVEIGGIPVMPPQTAAGALRLIRSDMNRYATLLAPIALLGLGELAARLATSWSRSTVRPLPTLRAALAGRRGDLRSGR